MFPNQCRPRPVGLGQRMDLRQPSIRVSYL
jgi:hypothetical protein